MRIKARAGPSCNTMVGQKARCLPVTKLGYHKNHNTKCSCNLRYQSMPTAKYIICQAWRPRAASLASEEADVYASTSKPEASCMSTLQTKMWTTRQTHAFLLRHEEKRVHRSSMQIIALHRDIPEAGLYALCIYYNRP